MVPQPWEENSSGKAVSSDFSRLGNFPTQTRVAVPLRVREAERRRRGKAWPQVQEWNGRV